MSNENIQLVRVTSNDLSALQKLSRETFLDTFAWGNTPENMQYYLDTSFADEKLMQEINAADSEFYFAQHYNKPIGYLKINLGQSQTEVLEGNGLEIERIYVIKEFHGKKIGQLLFNKALQLATEKNIDYLWLGVWEKNSKAITFYEKNGFVPFSRHIFKLGVDEQTDILMKRVLKKG